MSTTFWHSESISETLKHFAVDPERGLSAKQVSLLQEQGLLNTLPSKNTDPWWRVLSRQFLSPLIIILVIAAVISAFLQEWVDTGVISAAVGLNTIIGFIQEFKANRTLKQLRSLVQPHAMVLRDGKELDVPAVELVEGDILLLHAGDRVTADARLLESIELSVDESVLTGESLPLKKTIDPLKEGVLLAERTNMVYAGTSVVGGRGRAVVVGVGAGTELGKIATLVEETDEGSTPLQEQLSQLARWIAMVVALLVVCLFVLGIWKGESLFEMFELSVALAVAAIPEGLVVSVTIILAIGMQRILKRHSLVRRLVGAETLGSVSVLCTDKTGTVTEGEMRVTHLATPDTSIRFQDLKSGQNDSMTQLLELAALCNDAIAFQENHEIQFKGNPTQRALLRAALDRGINHSVLRATHKREAEIPFDSAYKYMVTQNAWGSLSAWVLMGASSRVLSFSSFYLKDGKRTALTKAVRERLDAQEQALTSEGLRMIAVAIREEIQSETLTKEGLGEFTFFGYIGLRDPLRPEVAEQIRAAKAAGVRTVMVTGDHPETARAIGAEAGLIAGPESVVVGSDLDAWSDAELEQRVNQITIYARVEPRHKIRIVHAWQARGEVVAMTGDGVNDAPALKAADIGLAVGSGTEVAKQASDVVILNNDLGTITAAIEEGRVIFDNIRKTTTYLLSGSFTEIILITAAIIMGWPIPLLPAHILWINLAADSFPNLGLTMEPAENGVMKRPPRARTERVVNREMLRLTIVVGVVANVVLITLYLWLLNNATSIEAVRSMMFAAVGINSLTYVFAFKSFRRTLFQSNPFSNLWLLGGVALGFGLMLLSLMHPFFQRIFEITPLRLSDWGLLLMIGVLNLIAIEIVKGVFILRNGTH